MSTVMKQNIFCIFCLLLTSYVIGDALHPVKYSTEDLFLKANNHERTGSVDEMNTKIEVIRTRRKFIPWDTKNVNVIKQLSTNSTKGSKRNNKRPNILFMLADDLGYGDLSLAPFTTECDAKDWPCCEGGILSPQLERMAKNGAIMTNFHSAAPVCSPARAAIMTGLYPWRMHAMNAFELGRDMTQRNGFLPQIPTGAEIFRENGYFTAHSGKWHLGGMREELRRDRAYQDKCSRPSPNQHGFEEYISELDGPETPRYTFLNGQSQLHSKGHKYLIKDDVPVPVIEKTGEENVLSDREAGDAIDFMREITKTRPEQPWFIQIWFNAPHGPWEPLKAGEELYSAKHDKPANFWKGYTCKAVRDQPAHPLYSQNWSYKTMVAAMDRSIGRVLDAVKELGLEEDTLIVFTSDNGNEMGAGGPGIYREGKRSLMEGGIRVPTVFQWKGKIPANSYSPYFGAHTDLVPTFLDAAGLTKPSHVGFDGLSLMSVLTRTTPITGPDDVWNNQFKHSKHLPGEKEIKERYFAHGNGNGSSSHSDDAVVGRVYLWHKDTDPYSRDERMQSAGYYEYIKVISSSGRGCIDRVFDMRHDPTERTNLVLGSHRSDCHGRFDTYDKPGVLEALIPANVAQAHCADLIKHNAVQNVLGAVSPGEQACTERYHKTLLSKLRIILDRLVPFALHGNRGHQHYMSDLIDKATCDIPVASQLKTLDFNHNVDCKTSPKECTKPEF